jgi:hypothetical protein
VELPALPAAASTVQEFLHAVPGRPSTDHRRQRAIRRAHQAAGMEPPTALPTMASTIRTGPGYVPAHQALAQLPYTQSTAGLRARRDGWLIVLLAVLGMTRYEASSIIESDVQLFPGLRVAGRTVSKADSPAECPACAVTRWLRVVGPASFGDRGAVRDIVSQSALVGDVHDCGAGLDGTWRLAATLLPAVDRRGYITSVPVSGTTMSAVMAARQRGADMPVRGVAPAKPEGQFRDATAAELYRAMGETYDQVDAEFERSAAAVVEALNALEELDGLWGREE